MAVAAGHALGEHFALQERAVVEHLIALLTVWPIQAVIQQSGVIVVGQTLAVDKCVAVLATARVAGGTGFDFHCVFAWFAARGVAGFQLAAPTDAAAFVEHLRQAFAGPAEGFCAGFMLGPGQVIGAGAMAGLAGHIDL